MDELARVLDEARAEQRGEERGRARDLRRAAEEGATFTGTLLDLAEGGSTVSIRTSFRRTYRGVIRLVASDFLAVTTAAGDVWLSLHAVTTARPEPAERAAAATGDRAVADLLLVEALGRLAPERPHVSLVTAAEESVTGELRAVGLDVVTVRLDGDPGGVCYVSASSVLAALLPPG